ncbi:hypothetical protein QC762_401550 [Podospora pseudocomata]|uniref:Heterokaryon incompatibility domain-containing protein n=1 Tax=Podospora pseudocomata TaxID=2093779 RepID=A0ABR0GEN8_9PEZI|nr:hypothetical protein QC762_401550 [Podospora pseudocomata]
MSSEPSLCTACKGLIHRLATEPRTEPEDYTVVAESFLKLEDSCAAGCPLCRLIRQKLVHDAFTTTKSFQDFRSVSAPIHVEFDENTIWVYSPAQDELGYKVQATLYRRPEEKSDDGVDDLRLKPEREIDDTGNGMIHSLQNDEGLEAVVAIARDWISNCLNRHMRCSMLATLDQSGHRAVPILPTRVIDVGGKPGAPKPRLVVQDGTPIQAEYFTLSYSWGGGVAAGTKLTPSNLETMQQGIDMASLPKTIQDAIIFTKKMGLVRYLWVDALCIIQQSNDASDDHTHKADWALECANFGRYYTGSLCTLAATGSLSSDEGLFLDRPGLDYPANTYTIQRHTQTGQPESLVIEPSLPSWISCISKGPLTSRGWAMQERAMSPRILHFTVHAVFWECAELSANEFQTEKLSNRIGWPRLPGEGLLSQRWLSEQSAEQRLHNSWYDLAIFYSGCQFTFPSDRLPALSGMAKKVWAMCAEGPEANLCLQQPKYYAGLWEGTIQRAIAWYSVWRRFNRSLRYTHRSHQRDGYIAPSWSWACLRDDHLQVRFAQSHQPGFAVYDDEGPRKICTEWKFPLEIMDIKVEHTGPDPMGGVSYGKLRVNGMLARVNGVEREMTPFDRGHIFEFFRTSSSGEEHKLRIHLDSLVDRHADGERYIFPYKHFHCLLVAFADEDTSGDEDLKLVGTQRVTTAALALRATGITTDGVEEYTRIGLVFAAREVLFGEAVKTVVDIV